MKNYHCLIFTACSMKRKMYSKVTSSNFGILTEEYSLFLLCFWCFYQGHTTLVFQRATLLINGHFPVGYTKKKFVSIKSTFFNTLREICP
jgi:hypothetical protein